MKCQSSSWILSWHDYFRSQKRRRVRVSRKTLFEMIGGVQTFLRVQCKRNITLIDKTGFRFRSLNSAFNFQ